MRPNFLYITFLKSFAEAKKRMENNHVNEELSNEQNPTPETEVTSTQQQPTEQQADTPPVEPVAETVSEPEAQVETQAEVQTEAPLVADTSSEDGSFASESEALKQVDLLLEQGKAVEYIPRAEVQELLLVLEQIGKKLTQETYANFMGLVKQIREVFEQRKTADAVSKEQEQRFSDYFGRINKKKAEFQKQNEEGQTERKKSLLNQLREMIEGGKLEHKIVKEIQDEWKTLRFILKEEREILDNSYRSLLNVYYSRKAQEQELLDYDRKHNLQKKNEIIDKIRSLLPTEEEATKSEVWSEKAKILADLQKEWKETGHVPKEDMERVNLEYKDVVENFYAQRREFFESQEQGLQENADKKRALLDKMKPYLEVEIKKPKDWEGHTKEFIALQEEWKTVGKAPQEVSAELWKEYRDTGNAFFERKTRFFKEYDEIRAQNQSIKEKLIEQAEALKDSMDWDKTTREMQRLQEEWKNSGPVSDKVATKMWNRFREACDAFFNNRNTHKGSVREEEDKNLEAKRGLVSRILSLMEDISDRDAIFNTAKEIQEEWKNIGRVPIKFKDTIWDEFKAAQDQLFGLLRESRKQSGDGGKFEKNRPSNRNNEQRGGGERNMPNEPDKRIVVIRKKIQKAQELVDQYSNNILYIARGKSGDALRAQIQAEIDKGLAEIAEYRKEIKEIQQALAAEAEKNKAPELVETPATTENVTEVVAETVAEVTETEASVETPAAEETTESETENPA